MRTVLIRRDCCRRERHSTIKTVDFNWSAKMPPFSPFTERVHYTLYSCMAGYGYCICFVSIWKTDFNNVTRALLVDIGKEMYSGQWEPLILSFCWKVSFCWCKIKTHIKLLNKQVLKYALVKIFLLSRCPFALPRHIFYHPPLFICCCYFVLFSSDKGKAYVFRLRVEFIALTRRKT